MFKLVIYRIHKPILDNMNVDYDKLRQLLLPSVLRDSSVLNAFLGAILQPIKTIYIGWKQYETTERRERTYNSQVKNLRRAISDRLGVAYESVIIYDVDDKEHLYIYRRTDNKDVIISADNPVIIYRESEIRYSRGFIVAIPSEYQNKIDEIRAVLDRYKIVTSRYYINWI